MFILSNSQFDLSFIPGGYRRRASMTLTYPHRSRKSESTKSRIKRNIFLSFTSFLPPYELVLHSSSNRTLPPSLQNWRARQCICKQAQSSKSSTHELGLFPNESLPSPKHMMIQTCSIRFQICATRRESSSPRDNRSNSCRLATKTTLSDNPSLHRLLYIRVQHVNR